MFKNKSAYVLFDIGGTKMRVAASFEGKKVEEPRVVNTPRDFGEGMVVLRKLALEVVGDAKIRAVAGGIPGIWDRERKELFHSPNLPLWTGRPIHTELSRMFKASVYLENDAALVGLGEAVLGAGKDSHIMAYITVSTGVGGARIVGRKIDDRTYGFEPGHQVIDMIGAACPTCNVDGGGEGKGHLEAYVSGRSVERRFGKKPEDIPGDNKLWDELASWLSVGLYNTILHWSPDTVVLGGSMMIGSPAIPVTLVREHLKKSLSIYPDMPRIEKATLGDLGGLYGALHLVTRTHKTL